MTQAVRSLTTACILADRFLRPAAGSNKSLLNEPEEVLFQGKDPSDRAFSGSTNCARRSGRARWWSSSASCVGTGTPMLLTRLLFRLPVSLCQLS